MRIDVIAGFLGSGKTTTILELLRSRAVDPARTVLLVNEFGQIGVDGALLADAGGDVRELASGCICCSLKNDFMAQIEDIRARLDPEHVLIEPSGVASLRDVLQAVLGSRVAADIEELRTVLVLDVDDYDWFVQMSEVFVEAQIGLAQLILLNKIDLSSEEAVAGVVADLERRNPEAVVLPTTYGRFSWAAVAPLLPALADTSGPSARLSGYASFSLELDGLFAAQGLRELFGAVSTGVYGEIRRAKGVFETDEGCLRLDLAGGRIHVSEWSCGPTGRFNAIGRELDELGLDRALAAAATGAPPEPAS